jgi:membrane dipeptidase
MPELSELIIGMGHRDIFELTERAHSEPSPLRDSWLPRLIRGGGGIVFLPVGGDGVHHRDGDPRPLVGSLDVLDLFVREVAKTEGVARIILAADDVPAEPDPDHVDFLMELEGGRPFQEDYSSGKSMERKLALLRCFHALGIRSVQLTHNGRNELGDGLDDMRTGGGLSEFGVAVVKELNRLNMLVGVSHLNDEGFFDALEVSSDPIVATHSNARAVYDHPRNLSDDQLRALAQGGGVAGMHFLAMMMAEYTMEHFLDHIDHVVKVTGSTAHVGIGYLGNDPPHVEVFPRKAASVPRDDAHPDGMGYREQCEALVEGLMGRGYDDQEIAQIMGGNYARVLREVLP